ncbi:MAG TPA: hypothetical protein DEB39_00945 [Planctomycetaceae bacterium]|nr:hypothetical protein [Planctomycetaceae bacterium]
MRASEIQVSQIFLAHRDFVIRLANHYAPFPGMDEDILQQVFLEFIRKKDSFDVASSDANVQGLLHSMIRIVAKRYWSERMRTQPETLRKIAEHVHGITETIDIPDVSLEKRALASCLEKMPDKSKQLIQFHYYDDKKLYEIASMMQMKTSTVSKAICRIREQLRECIRRYCRREECHV